MDHHLCHGRVNGGLAKDVNAGMQYCYFILPLALGCSSFLF